jgi:hypothetical protein
VNWQGFLAKYSGVTGDMVWAKELTVTGGATGAPVRSLIGDGANVLAIGDFYGTVDLGGAQLTSTSSYTDVFVARFSGANGSALVAKRFGDAGIDTGSDIARDGTTAVLVTGSFTSQVDFGTGPMPSQGGTDAFLLKLDPSTLAATWAKTFGSSGDDQGVSVAVASNGEIALAANVAGIANFGGGPLAYVGTSDFVLARYSSAGAHLYSKSWGGLQVDKAHSVVWAGSSLGFAGEYYLGPIDFGTGALPTDKTAFVAHLVP